MNRPRFDTGERTMVTAQEPPIEVQIVYEDLAAGLRAKQFADRLAKRLGCAGPLQPSLWRFDFLQDAALREAAARTAAAADLVLVAAGGGAVLPEAISRWVERCLALTTDEPPAWVLLDPRAEPDRATESISAALGGALRRAGIEVFTQVLRAQPESEELTTEAIRYRADTTTAVLSDALSHTEHWHRHWGLNE